MAKGKGKAVFRTRREDRKPLASAATVFLIFFSLLTAAPAHAAKADLPSFGKGKIEVRLYTDYFCGPCGRMEPRVEALLADLVKRNTVTLIFVDTPIHRFTPLYAKYFLYILNNDRAFAHVLQYRALLFEAAKGKIETGDKLEEFLKGERRRVYPDRSRTRPCRPFFPDNRGRRQVDAYLDHHKGGSEGGIRRRHGHCQGPRTASKGWRAAEATRKRPLRSPPRSPKSSPREFSTHPLRAVKPALSSRFSPS